MNAVFYEWIDSPEPDDTFFWNSGQIISKSISAGGNFDAYSNPQIDSLTKQGVQTLDQGQRAVEVDADLGHGGSDGGVDLVGRGGSGGADIDPACGMVLQKGGGHLRTAGVVHADEQHLCAAPGGVGGVDRAVGHVVVLSIVDAVWLRWPSSTPACV